MDPIQNSEPVALCRNSDGSSNLAVRGTHLHSTRDPRREAERLAAEILRLYPACARSPSESPIPPEKRGDPDTGSDIASRKATTGTTTLSDFRERNPASTPPFLLIVVGTGWGYLMESLERAAKPGSICYFEPLADILMRMEESGRRRELSLPPPGIFHDPDSLRRYLLGLSPLPEVQIFVTPVYARLFPGIADAIRERIEGAAAGVDRSTRHRFFRTWSRNFFCLIQSRRGKTLEFITTTRASTGNETSPSLNSSPAPSTGRDSGEIAGRLFLYCGAGPGLIEELTPYLGALRDPRNPVLLLAADTALGPLLSLGLRPSLLLSVDSGRGTLYHFRVAERYGLRPPFPFPLLTWSARPRYADRFFSHVLHYRTTFPFDQILGTGPLAGVPEWSNPSRNVSGVALLATEWMGGSVLYTAGSGFRARHGQTHERGTGYQLYSLEGQSRITPAEMFRARGYGEELTEKNRLSLQGLTNMAEELQIELRPLAANGASFSRELDASFARETMDAKDHREQSHGDLPLQRFPEVPEESTIAKLTGDSLARYLLEQRDRLPLASILPLDPRLTHRDLEKWFRFFL